MDREVLEGFNSEVYLNSKGGYGVSIWNSKGGVGHKKLDLLNWACMGFLENLCVRHRVVTIH